MLSTLAKDVIDQHLSVYPGVARKELESRLFGLRAAQSLEAFWELWMFAWLVDQGYEVEVHPTVTGSRHKPDFVACGAGGEFYLEASVLNESREIRDFYKNCELMYATINEIPHPELMLSVHVKAASPNRPPRRAVASFLEPLYREAEERLGKAVIGQSDAPALLAANSSVSHGWAVNVGAYRRPEAAIGATDFPMTAMRRISPRFSDDQPAIREKIASKASWYGELDKPLLLALLSNRDFLDFEDLGSVLASSAYVDQGVAPGLFTRDSGCAGLSGLLACLSVNALLDSSVRPQLRYWSNPYARTPLETPPLEPVLS